MFNCVRQDSREASSGQSHQAAAQQPRKHRIQVQLIELEGVTLSNGVLFAKVRLVGGGRFCQYSARKEIRDNKVVWSDYGPMEFACRLGGPGPCTLRVSVRKEERGGRSFSKLGFAILDLTALGRPASSTQLEQQELSCILSPYSQRQRLDNSTLKLSIRRISAAGGATAAATAATATSGLHPTSSSLSAEPSGLDNCFSPAAAAAATVVEPSSHHQHHQQHQQQLHRRNPSIATAATAPAATYALLQHSRTNSMDAQQSSLVIAATQSQIPNPDGLLHPTVSSQSSSVHSFDLLQSSLERKRAALTPAREHLNSRIVNTRTDNFKIAREVLENSGIRIASQTESN